MCSVCPLEQVLCLVKLINLNVSYYLNQELAKESHFTLLQIKPRDVAKELTLQVS